MVVKDIDDEAPRPLNDSMLLTNELNSTYNIEFIDEDEGATSIHVNMTKGFEYFELANAIGSNQRSPSSQLRQTLPAGKPADFAILQIKSLPADLKQFEFEACDDAGNCANSTIMIHFPQNSSETLLIGISTNLAIIIAVIIILLFIIILIVIILIKYYCSGTKRKEPPQTHTPLGTPPPTPPPPPPLVCFRTNNFLAT